MMCGESVIVGSLRRGGKDAALLDDGEAVAIEPDDGAVGVRQQDHLAHAEIEEDLGADAVVAQLGDGIAAVFDEPPHAIEQAGRQRLAEQDDNAAAHPGDHLHRALQHAAATAGARTQHIVQHVERVHADRNRFGLRDVTLDQRDVLYVGDGVNVDVHPELSAGCPRGLWWGRSRWRWYARDRAPRYRSSPPRAPRSRR